MAALVGVVEEPMRIVTPTTGSARDRGRYGAIDELFQVGAGDAVMALGAETPGRKATLPDQLGDRPRRDLEKLGRLVGGDPCTSGGRDI